MEPFDYSNKPYRNALEAKCAVCKEPATTNINQVNGSILGLCDMDYETYRKKQLNDIQRESKTIKSTQK
jgi:hypothetical protein